MGKKKGKKQEDNSWDHDTSDDIPSTATTTTGEMIAVQKSSLPQKGGKKSKRQKQQNDIEDDIEADLQDIAAIIADGKTDPTGGATPVSNETPPTANSTQVESTPPITKKTKKSRKKDFEEIDVLQELEQLDINETITSTVSDKEIGKKGRKSNNDDDIDQLVTDIKGVSVKTDTPTTKLEEGGAQGNRDDHDEEEAVPTVHIKTKAEKKAAKKERQKELKKQPKHSAPNEATPTAATTPIVEATPIEESTSKSTIVSEAKNTEGDSIIEASVDVKQVAEVVEEEGDIDEDKKSKKKKKKKTGPAAEDDKKAAKSKKVKSAVQKMKEEIEALRIAQKKREEELLAKQRAEEEAEKERLEKLRLEKERKEKKKQKEKERKERLKKEGKYLTKSEKEKKARAELQLQAMIAQGIQIPQKVEGEKKVPVRYGSRIKKPKQQTAAAVTNEEHVDEEIESNHTDEGISEATSITEESVKDNWDDDDDDDNDSEVKDNWDDDDDDEGVEEEEPEGKDDVLVGGASTGEVGLTPVDHAFSSEDESDEESDEESEASSESGDNMEDGMTPYDIASKRIQDRRVRNREERTSELLRSPVVCVLGHVDTGKTKILDKIRHTNVQDGEAGGITQQIGATFVPQEAILEQTKMMKEFQKMEMKLPGLLIIDTPGHESFSNLRTRGSSMCDIAILVVDIMHGLEPQTIESLNLLRKGNVPFVVALNKIDRLLDWRRNPTGSVKETLKRQKPNTRDEFDERLRGVIVEFAEQGLNAALYWDKVDFKEYIPLVPTSAHSGDGMGDLISLIVSHSQSHLTDNLMFCKEIEAIVLEVKVIPGLGTTVDVILRNGILNEGDTLVLSGMDGPFSTQARALLMPQPMRELRVKNPYINHKTVTASQGVKITGKDLEKTLAGMPVLVAKRPDEVDVLKDEAAANISSALGSFKLSERGVFVQASTLGSLEALLEFLKTSKIPYAGVNIGPVHKKDVMKASIMLDRDSQWACILAFDVRVEREAQEIADNLGVRIFTADIIYHLFDNFMKYREDLKEAKRRENEHIATFPCKLKILPNCVFNARNPIVVGVSVVNGIVKPGTTLVVPSKEFVNIGTIVSIENNHKSVEIAHKGSEVCIKIEATPGEAPKLFGRHFDYDDMLVSKISRESIDAVKKYFRDDLQKSDWQLMIELKKVFQIY